jgi:hypothetical protein
MNVDLVQSGVTLVHIHDCLGWWLVIKSAVVDHKALHALLQRQQQVIGRAQVLACGMTQGVLRCRIMPNGSPSAPGPLVIAGRGLLGDRAAEPA